MGRSETVTLSDANTLTVLSTQTVSSFANGVYLQWKISGNVLITFTKLAGPNPVLSGLFFDSPTTTPTATANYIKTDATTQGDWYGTYGTQGYNVIGYTASNPSYPSYAVVTPSGNSIWNWASSTTDPRALQNPSAPTGSRLADTWYASNGTSFTVDVDLTDGRSHDLELYLMDWPNVGRSETVTLSDANTLTVLSTQTVSSFANGVYLQWKISGNVLITFTKLAGPNPVLSGLFFDSPTMSKSSALMSSSSVSPASQPRTTISSRSPLNTPLSPVSVAGGTALVALAPCGTGTGSLVANAMGTVDFGSDETAAPLSAADTTLAPKQKHLHDVALEQVSRGNRRIQAILGS